MLLVCIYIPNSLVSHKSFVLHLPGFCSSGFCWFFFWNKSNPLTHNSMGHVPMHRQKCFSQICLDTPLLGHSELCDSDILTAQSSTQMQKNWFSQQMLRLQMELAGPRLGKNNTSYRECPGSTGCWAEGAEAVRKGWCPAAGSEDSLCQLSADPMALSEVKLQSLVGEMLPLQKTSEVGLAVEKVLIFLL